MSSTKNKKNDKSNKLSIAPTSITVDLSNAIDTNLGQLDKQSKQQLKKDSDDDYRRIVSQIVNISGNQLNKQNESKNKIKNYFIKFFKWILIAQLVALFAILIYYKAFVHLFHWITQ